MTTQHASPKIKPAPKKKKTKDSIEKHLMAEIIVPATETWKNEFAQFTFTKEQEHELKNLIQQIDTDIKYYNARQHATGLRSENKRRLIALEKMFGKLRYFLESFEQGMDNWLPFDSREKIGLLSNFLKAEEIHADKVYSTRINREIDKASMLQRPLSIQQIEEKLEASRKSIGLLSGHKILKHFIQEVHDPLKKWVELERFNQGGVPGNKTARFIVYWLAWMAPEITGQDASVAREGPFVRLCSAVLNACGVPNARIGASVPKMVAKAHADREKYRESTGLSV